MNTSFWNSERPLSREEYDQFGCALLLKFKAFGLECHFPKVVHKDTYASVCLVCVPEESVDFVGTITAALEINRLNHEGSFAAFNYQGIKVEMHAVKPQELDFALNYLSYGTAGTLPGKILHRMGMKLCARGLFYLIRDSMFDGDAKGGHILEEVFLTLDWNQALSFLSLRAEPWRDGFEVEDQVFEFMATSKEFSAELYFPVAEPANVGAIVEKATELDVFAAFKSWMRNKSFPKKEFLPRRAYRKYLFQIFPPLKNRMFANSGKVLRKKEIHRKLNLDLIRSWVTPEKEQTAFEVLKMFRQRHDELEILAMSQDDIRAGVVTYHSFIQLQQNT